MEFSYSKPMQRKQGGLDALVFKAISKEFLTILPG